MRLTLILSLVFFFLSGCNSPEIKSESFKIPDIKGDRASKNIVVRVSGDNKIFLGNEGKEILREELDSVLRSKINEAKMNPRDTAIRVVINADTAARYGVVFSIIEAAGRWGAKVITNVR